MPNHLSADCTIPTSTAASLPWWDQLRYTWRGVVSVRIRQMSVLLANSQSPRLTSHDPRLVLTAATLNVDVEALKINLTSTAMSAVAYGAAPDSGPSKCRHPKPPLSLVAC